jgi:hypothetical protein
MSKPIHKGTELNNVRETWEQNEKQQSKISSPASNNESLENKIQEEAKEYDDAHKEDRLLGGERASVNDDSNQ